MKAKVAKVYGWTDRYISKMNYKKFLEYHKAALIMDAEDALNSYVASMYSNYKQNTQKKLWTQQRNEISRLLERSEEEKSKTSNLEKLVKAMQDG